MTNKQADNNNDDGDDDYTDDYDDDDIKNSVDNEYVTGDDYNWNVNGALGRFDDDSAASNTSRDYKTSTKDSEELIAPAYDELNSDLSNTTLQDGGDLDTASGWSHQQEVY